MEVEHIQCSKCGCRGIHACIGYKMPPMTPEKKAELMEAIMNVKSLRDKATKRQESK